MTLLLKNQDMPGLVSTDECIEAIESAFAELGRGEAQELPRRRIYHPHADRPSHYYWFNEMAGVVPGIRSMGLRVNSATVAVETKRGNARLGFPGAFSALVFLFDTKTTELLAVLQDFYLNPIRVAATSAIVTRRLARDYAAGRVWISSAKAERELGYTFRPAREALARSIRWYLANGYVPQTHARRIRLELRPA